MLINSEVGRKKTKVAAMVEMPPPSFVPFGF